MSQWHLSLVDASNLTERQVEGLVGAYIERKKFEAKVTLAMLGEALQGKREQASLADLAMAGFGIRGV